MHATSSCKVINELGWWWKVAKTIEIEDFLSSLFVCYPVCAGTHILIQIHNCRLASKRSTRGQCIAHENSAEIGNFHDFDNSREIEIGEGSMW